MNKSMLIGVAIVAAGALSVGAVGSYVAFKGPRYAADTVKDGQLVLTQSGADPANKN